MDQDQGVDVSPNGVIIAFNLWEQHWKPLNQKYNSVVEELNRYKTDKDVRITLFIQRCYVLNPQEFSNGIVEIGIIRDVVDGGKTIDYSKAEVHRGLKEVINDFVSTNTEYFRPVKMLSVDDIDRNIDKFEEKIRASQKAAEALQKEEQRIKKQVAELPWIVRWLFKIKIDKQEAV